MDEKDNFADTLSLAGRFNFVNNLGPLSGANNTFLLQTFFEFNSFP